MPKQYEESLFERRERERLEAIKSAAASGVDHTLDDLDVLQRIEELKALRRIKAAAKRAFDIYAHNIDTNVPTLPVLDRVASMLVFNETMIDLGRALAGADE